MSVILEMAGAAACDWLFRLRPTKGKNNMIQTLDNDDPRNMEALEKAFNPKPSYIQQVTTDLYKQAVYKKRPASRPAAPPPWIIIDDFCPEIDAVRASALASGFGTWRPNKGQLGSSNYEGMNFVGTHSLMLKPLSQAMGRCVFSNTLFFRIALPETEAAYTHSDREMGQFTCVAYLSDHEEEYGTGFFRHRVTGLTEMPAFEVMNSDTKWDALKRDMISGGEDEWEQIGFCPGQFNRAVIFHAPIFHARCPKTGLGNDASDARMVWVSHFCI